MKKLRNQKGISQAQLLDVYARVNGHMEYLKNRVKYNLIMLVKLKQILEREYDDLLP